MKHYLNKIILDILWCVRRTCTPATVSKFDDFIDKDWAFRMIEEKLTNFLKEEFICAPNKYIFYYWEISKDNQQPNWITDEDYLYYTDPNNDFIGSYIIKDEPNHISVWSKSYFETYYTKIKSLANLEVINE